MTSETIDVLKLENQICFPLYAAARKVTGGYTPFLKPLGLTYTQYLVMMVLWEHKSVTVGELGKKLFLDSGTLTPVVKKMEANGLVTRTRNDEDERVVDVAITDAGEALREQAEAIPEALACRMPLAPEEALELYRLLYKLLEA